MVLSQRGFSSGDAALWPQDERVLVRMDILAPCASEGQAWVADSVNSRWKDKLANTLWFSKL